MGISDGRRVGADAAASRPCFSAWGDCIRVNVTRVRLSDSCLLERVPHFYSELTWRSDVGHTPCQFCISDEIRDQKRFSVTSREKCRRALFKRTSFQTWRQNIGPSFTIDAEFRNISIHDPWAGRVLEEKSVGAVSAALPRRAVIAARFSPRWCRWFLSALCSFSLRRLHILKEQIKDIIIKDASGRRCADVFTANGCGQQGTGAARAALPRRAVRALVPLVERTLALRQATMTHCGVSVSRPGPSSWGEKGHDDSTVTLHPAFMAPGKVGVRCLANVCGCSRTGI